MAWMLFWPGSGSVQQSSRGKIFFISKACRAGWFNLKFTQALYGTQ
jgi:hypothetical protein